MKNKLLMILAAAILLVGCGNQQEANNTESQDAHKHSYTESTTKEATCTEAGEKTFSCDCGDTYTETIETVGHEYTDEIIAPTCTTKGYTTHACKICGDAYTDTEVSATNHSYGGYTYNNDASYEKDGTETATCSACGEKTTRTKVGTKLVKAEPEKPAECPVEMYKLIDEGDRIYCWVFFHASPKREGYGAENRAILDQGHALAVSKWELKYDSHICREHIRWENYDICLVEWIPYE